MPKALFDNRNYKAMTVEQADALFREIALITVRINRVKANFEKKIADLKNAAELTLGPDETELERLSQELRNYIQCNPERFIRPRQHLTDCQTMLSACCVPPCFSVCFSMVFRDEFICIGRQFGLVQVIRYRAGIDFPQFRHLPDTHFRTECRPEIHPRPVGMIGGIQHQGNDPSRVAAEFCKIHYCIPHRHPAVFSIDQRRIQLFQRLNMLNGPGGFQNCLQTQ